MPELTKDQIGFLSLSVDSQEVEYVNNLLKMAYLQ